MTTQAQTYGDENPTVGAASPQAGDAHGEAVTVETRFGPLTFDETNSVSLLQGIIGFPQFRKFGLAAIPDPRMAQFKLLQSLEQADLSFLVLPVRLDGQTIADRDVDEACVALHISREDAAFLLLVTVRKEANGIAVSTNMRAPIVLDTCRRIARQYVMPNPRYPIRQPL
jgi:flagellar assembly factor FliW